MKIKHFTAATLAALMCLSSSMMNVFADDTSSDDHTTNIGYTVDESYKWQAPADIVFTSNIDTEVKTGTVSVTENIIEATKTLVISIGSGEDFKLTSAEGAQRDYTVSKESEVLSAGSRVLLVPSGTYDGAQDLNFELQGVANGNTSQKAGIYTDTLNFEAVLTSSYRIEYHLDGGVNDPSNPATYEKDSGDINLANPSKEGYTFDGWYTEPEFTNRVTSIVNGTEGNIDLYAKFTALSYTITYVLDGGTNNVSNPNGYDLTTLPITLLNPTKDGYTFAGWYETSDFSGSPVIQIDARATGNKTFYAKWNLDTYTIAYDLDGGTNNVSNPTSYTIDSLPLTLNNPTKDGYTFTGWTGSNGSTPQKNVQITASDLGNKSYTANWEVKVVAATFSDGTGLSWEELKLEANGKKYGYKANAISDTSIGSYAFSGCVPLRSITIPNSVTSIGNYAFIGSDLTSITIPDSITSIGKETFRSCSRLKRINSDTDGVFNIPNSVTSIGDYAFQDCSKFTSITIPNSVTSIGIYAFYGCTSLTSITFAEGINLTNMGESVFANLKKLTSITFPESGFINIGTSAFKGCTGLTSINIPSSVKSIGYKAFMDCTNLKRINSDTDGVFNIPDNITSIDEYAFYNCTGLTSVTFEGNSQLTSINEDIFASCKNLTSITIPESVTDIASSAFENCTSLTSINIPSSVTSITPDSYQYYFNNCTSLASINVDTKNTVYSSENGILYNKDKTTLIFSPYGNSSVSVPGNLPNSVTSIGDYAFASFKGLTSFYIENSVRRIGNYAFQNCTDLTSITISNSVTSIGDYAFDQCSSLTSIDYIGTKEEWNSISLGYYWAGGLTIHCTDGDIEW